MTNRSSLLLFALLLGNAGSILGQAPCTPPESMKAELQGKPNAAALNDLGVWFGEQKQYDCATSAFATSLQEDPDQKDVAHVAFMLGVSLDFTGDTKEAIGALQEAEQLGYNDIKLHVRMPLPHGRYVRHPHSSTSLRRFPSRTILGVRSSSKPHIMS